MTKKITPKTISLDEFTQQFDENQKRLIGEYIKHYDLFVKFREVK